jgi:hypothetical protein
MGQAAMYTIRLNGHLDATFLSAFPDLESRHLGPHTALTGALDRSALFGVLARLRRLAWRFWSSGSTTIYSQPRVP